LSNARGFQLTRTQLDDMNARPFAFPTATTTNDSVQSQSRCI
jgi:hypothetical protein